MFGCYGFSNRKYCILNKQYSKADYEALVPKVIAHMNAMPYVDAMGREYRYGEFFPSEISFFAYNESLAQQYFPLTKEEALAHGYRWRDPEEKHHAVTKEPDALPDHIKDTDASILKDVIDCEHKGTCNEQCFGAFRIIPGELDFLKAMNLPLPRLCPNCRHYGRLHARDLIALHSRTCMCRTPGHAHGDRPCGNTFETSYAPDRPEIIHCEECYNAEVA